jgi:septum formation protein
LYWLLLRRGGDSCWHRWAACASIWQANADAAQLGLTNVEVCPSKFAENLPKALGALNYVLETASAKAVDVYSIEINNAERGEPALVIAADTIIVSHTGRILEKPRGEVDHITMLKMLRDQGEHKVMTAVVVMRPLESAVDPGYKMETHVEETTVKFDQNGMGDIRREWGTVG